MAYEKFIKAVESDKMLKEIERKSIFASHCNRDYSGEVKQLGDQIRVDGLGDVTIYSYSKDGTYTVNGTTTSGKNVIQGNMPSAENPVGYTATFTINQFETFNISIGDIDKELAKNGDGLLGKYRAKATAKIAKLQDEYICSAITGFTDAQWKDTSNDRTSSTGSVHSNVYYITDGDDVTTQDGQKVNVFNFIDGLVQELHERDIDDVGEYYCECTPHFFRILKKALRGNGGLVDSERNKMIKGTEVCEYNGVTFAMTNCSKMKVAGTTDEYVILRHVDAVSFWNPLVDVASYSLETSGKGFGDAVMGYSYYDCGITMPKAMIWAKVNY